MSNSIRKNDEQELSTFEISSKTKMKLKALVAMGDSDSVGSVINDILDKHINNDLSEDERKSYESILAELPED